MLDKLFYQEKGLFLQSLHPLAAVTYLGTLLVLSLAFNNPLYLCGILLVVLLTIWTADGWEAWESYLKISLPMILLIIVINPLMIRAGKTVLWYGPQIPILGRLTISLEAIYYGAAMSVRLLDIISLFCLYNLIVHPDKALNLFSRIAGKSTLVISLTTRLFPAMVRELENIRGVQQLRGIDFKQGTVKEKVKKYSSLISILLMSSLEDSQEIAESMQARAFGSGPRSRYSRNLLRPRDILCLSGSSLALAVSIWGVLHGFGSYTFYPQMDYLINGTGTVAVLVAVLLSLSVPAMLSWGWRYCPCIKSKI